jgi:hypothetical protein
MQNRQGKHITELSSSRAVDCKTSFEMDHQEAAITFPMKSIFFEMCRRFSYGNYTWKNTFGKTERGSVRPLGSTRIASIPYF